MYRYSPFFSDATVILCTVSMFLFREITRCQGWSLNKNPPGMDHSRRTTSEPFLAPTTSCWKTVTTWRNVRQRQSPAPGLEGTEHESLSRNLFFWVKKDIAPSTYFPGQVFLGGKGECSKFEAIATSGLQTLTINSKNRDEVLLELTPPYYPWDPLRRHTRRCGKPIKTN